MMGLYVEESSRVIHHFRMRNDWPICILLAYLRTDPYAFFWHICVYPPIKTSEIPESTKLWHGLHNFLHAYIWGTLIYSLIWWTFVESVQNLSPERFLSRSKALYHVMVTRLCGEHTWSCWTWLSVASALPASPNFLCLIMLVLATS